MALHIVPDCPRIRAWTVESTVRPVPSLSHLSMRDEQIVIYSRKGWTIDGICIELGHDRRVVLAALRREAL